MTGGESVYHQPYRAPSIADKFAPQIAEADAAISEARALRDQNKALRDALTFKSKRLEEAADLIDDQEQRIAILLEENRGFRIRMQMFAEAAQAIISEVTKESADAPFVRKGSELVRQVAGKPAEPVKPVREVGDTVEYVATEILGEARTISAAEMRLRNTPLFLQSH